MCFKDIMSPLRFTILFGLLATFILGESNVPINLPPTLRVYRDWKVSVNETVGNKITVAEAADDDGDPIKFYIKPKEKGGVFPDASTFFRINSETGEVYLNSSLKGKEGKYLLYVTADDGHLGQTTEVLVEVVNRLGRLPPRSSGASTPRVLLTIPTAIPFNSKQANIEVINLPPTLIIQRDWRISVNEAVGNRIAVAEAYDDDGDLIKFHIKPKEEGGVFPDASKFFRINSETGEVYLNSSLKGKEGKYLLYVIADDGHLGQTTEVLVEIVTKLGGGYIRPVPLGLPPPKPGSISFPIPQVQFSPVSSGQALPSHDAPTMVPINSSINSKPINIPPSLIIEREWKISVNETVGNRVAIAEASDDDGDPIKFYIRPKEDGGVFPDASIFFRINSDSGEIYLNKSLKEKEGKYLLYVIADDGHLGQKTEVLVEVVNKFVESSKRPFVLGVPPPRPGFGSFPMPQFPSNTSGHEPLPHDTTPGVELGNSSMTQIFAHTFKSPTPNVYLLPTTSALPTTANTQETIENVNHTVLSTFVIPVSSTSKLGFKSSPTPPFLPITSSRAPSMLTNATTRAHPTTVNTEKNVENITMLPTYDGRPKILNNSDIELIPSINITETKELPSDSNTSIVVVGSIAAIFGLVIVVAIGLYLTKGLRGNKNLPSHEDGKNSVSVFQDNSLFSILPKSECVPNSLTRAQSNNYEAPTCNVGDRTSICLVEQIQVESKWEFPRNKLKTINIIGEGCFGRVWKAEAQDINSVSGVTIVAVKTLKENAGESDKKDLLSELEIMKLLDPHPNIIRLFGCCTEKDPPFVIMEFALLGTLQNYLRNSRAERFIYYKNLHGGSKDLTSKDLTSFAYHVAKGMEYLSSKNIIHRDLAARNILIGADRTCKVADFGFARDVVPGGIYQKKSEGGLPIRWMAPECVYDNIFTTQGDVWSFGVLLWEIVTLGSTPYPGWSALRVVKEIREGQRLEKPKHCKRKLYSLMYYCWNEDPSERPSFTELAQSLEKLLLEDIEYIKLNLFPEHTYYNMFFSGEKV